MRHAEAGYGLMSPAPKRENIFDLTAHESARLGLPPSELLIEAFEAVAQKKLQAHFDESPSTTILIARTGVTWRALIKQAISALERDPHFFARWFRFVMVDMNDYRHWRKTTLKEQEPPRIKFRSPVSQVQKGMERYLDGELAAGRKGCKTCLGMGEGYDAGCHLQAGH